MAAAIRTIRAVAPADARPVRTPACCSRSQSLWSQGGGALIRNHVPPPASQHVAVGWRPEMFRSPRNDDAGGVDGLFTQGARSRLREWPRSRRIARDERTPP